MGDIYKIINDVNDQIYVGKAVDGMEKRKRSHLSQLHDGTDIHNAILDIGLEHFTWVLIETNIEDKELLIEREKYWIAFYDSYNNGYNMTPGGEGGNGTHAENLRRWREENPEQMNKIVQNLIQWTKDNPDKVKENNKKAAITRARRYGKDITKEANKACKKKVLCIETGIIYDGASEAARALGYKGGAHIGQVCNGQRQTAFKYHWKWAD